MLEVRGLTRRFGDIAALDDVSFRIEPGEVLGLVGPNGSGKTTLLEALCGLQPVERGDVIWQGKALPDHRRKDVLFYMPDGIVPYAEHRTKDVLTFFARAFAKSSAAVGDRVDALALSSALPKRVGALSKGFRRRLLIAIALLSPHPILLMDEPFDGLDVRQKRDVAVLLAQSRSQRRTLFLSIHELIDAERICDRLVLLASGKVCGEGTADELRARAGSRSASLEDVFLALT